MKKEEKLLKKCCSFKNNEERDSFLASLSDKDFYDMMRLPIGNISRIHLTKFRKEKQTANLNKYIIHIPHSSLEIPKYFKNNLLVDEEYFNKENIFICDYLVDKFIPNNFNNIIKFKYSRMFCDVERYLDNSKEEMSKHGMGVLYTKDSNSKVFVNRQKDEKLTIDLYKKHHEELDNMVERILSKYNNCFIIDLHSFSDEFVYKMFNIKNNPDICIGINNNYDKELLEKTINHFNSYEYSIKINYPYSGSIISNRFPEVNSMMIEINKRIYLNNQNNFDKLYKCMMEYWELLKRY